MFDLLKKALQAENDTRNKETADFIRDEENGLRRYSTAAKWDAYKAGTITREKAAELATRRALKANKKYNAAELAKIEAAETAEEVQEVTINVQWTHSRTWGYNPTATVQVETAHSVKTYTGHASGCGYDKRTAAIGNALNESPAIKKMLCARKEAAMQAATAEGENGSNAACIAYGAGYGVLPYFEGGVGWSSFRRVFEVCGYNLEVESGTKTTDFYYIKKAAADAATA